MLPTKPRRKKEPWGRKGANEPSCASKTEPRLTLAIQASAMKRPRPADLLRIGVGVLRKPEEPRFQQFKTHEIVDSGKWTRPYQAQLGGVRSGSDRSVLGIRLSLPHGSAAVPGSAANGDRAQSEKRRQT